jgi:hypothetical protein
MGYPLLNVDFLFGAIFLPVAGFSLGQRPWQSVAIGTMAVTFVLSARITIE